MNLPRLIIRRLRALFLKDRLDAEMLEEMRLHLELQEQANKASGMSSDEARHAARRQFGGITQVQETCRDQRGFRWLEDALQDARYGVRQCLHAPGFTAIVVLTLALGIGLNTGIFSMFKAIALRPLPGVLDSKDLVTLMWLTPGGDKQALSYLELRDFRERCGSFQSLEGSVVLPFSLQVGEEAQRVWGEYVTGSEQAMFGLKPFLGRLLTASDDVRGVSPTLVVSHRFWRKQLGEDPGIVGHKVLLNGKAFTLVGVAQEGYGGSTIGFSLDVFVPFGMAGQVGVYNSSAEAPYVQRSFHCLAAVGRLKPGVTLEQAQAEVGTVGEAMNREYPPDEKGKRIQLVNVRQSPFGAATYVGPMLGIMMGMTALVLLIMCANVASLLLARASVRRHELAIRLALGAGRWRLVRQLLTESILLALAGGLLGALLSLGTPTLVTALVPSSRFPILLNTEPDITVFLFTLAVSVCSAVVFGLMPALQSSSLNLASAIKVGRVGGKTPMLWGRNLLVVLQIAIALPLVVSAGLLLRSHQKALHADFGFSTRNVALLAVDLGSNGYSAEKARDFHERLVERLSGLPGVEAVGLSTCLPLCTVPPMQAGIEVEGYVRAPDESAWILYQAVSRDYFRSLKISLLQGREFDQRDVAKSVPVAVVNETFAKKYWSGQDPVGRHFKLRGIAREVVGVARDIKYLVPGEAPRPVFYLSLAQFHASEVQVLIRGAGDPRMLCKEARQQVMQLDPHLPVFGVEPMDDYMSFALFMQKLAAGALSIAGAMGLLLTGMGSFGLVSFLVSSRTREIGLRMALGATRGSVMMLVMRRGFQLAILGIVLGLGLALGAAQMMTILLYDVAATDAVTFASALAIVALTATLACWLPARKAIRVDPLVALRTE